MYCVLFVARGVIISIIVCFVARGINYSIIANNAVSANLLPNFKVILIVLVSNLVT